mgnify:FL=1
MTWRLPFLAAYPFLKKFPAAVARHADALDLFVDSGAFTAWTLKIDITLDEYCGFLDGLPVRPWNYLTLDVIGDPEGTRRNFDEMRRRGYAPVPIVTRGDGPGAIEDYYTISDYVAFGGVAGVTNSSAAWCKAVMGIVGRRKAHLLGMTRMEWVKALRPYSVDSSSWMQAARFGTVAVYMGGGVMKQFDPRRGPPPRDVAARIRRYGIDPFALAKGENLKGAWGLGQQVTALSWVELSMDSEAAIGTRVFLAAATEQYLDQLVWAREKVLDLRRPRATIGEAACALSSGQ